MDTGETVCGIIVPDGNGLYKSVSDTIENSPFDIDTLLVCNDSGDLAVNGVIEYTMGSDTDYQVLHRPDWVDDTVSAAALKQREYIVEHSDCLIALLCQSMQDNHLVRKCVKKADHRGLGIYRVAIRQVAGEEFRVLQRTHVEHDQSGLGEF